MAVILYALHGRGRGHASRSLPVVRQLRANGWEVVVQGGGDALDLAAPSDGLVPADPVRPGVFMPFDTGRRLWSDHQRLLAADLVISDGDLPTALAAKRRGTPCLLVGHDLVFSRCRLPPGMPRWALVKQRLNAWHGEPLWRTPAIAVHFLPILPRTPDTRVARPATPSWPDDPAPTPSHRLVAYTRDGDGAELLRAAAERGWPIDWFGPGARAMPGVVPHPFARESFMRHLRSASGVIGSAGSNLLAECVFAGCPVFAVHDERDAEQALNARLVTETRVGVGCRRGAAQRHLDTWLARVSAGDFARVDLPAALPWVGDAVVAHVAAVLGPTTP